jgi:hydrogenase maturation factor
VDDKILPLGKLPISLLETLLKSFFVQDPDLLVGPKIGEDAAVVRVGERKLILKTDPITFLSQDMAWYLITVNANDIACMGGVSRYLLVTALLPVGTTVSQVESLFSDLKQACSVSDIALIGGHTEITYGIDRTIAIGFMIGFCEGEVIGASGTKPGDLVLLSKSIPLEATSILARQMPERLKLDEASLQKARDLIFDPGISVVREAGIATAIGVTAMHDPTEGGLATGLLEIARASACGIEVDQDRIPVIDIAQQILPVLGIDPLGAIASGSLIACCAPENAQKILTAWKGAGIQGTIIGRMTEGGLTLLKAGKREPLPEFDRDEIARFMEQG